MGEDTAQLVSPGRARRSSSYTEPGSGHSSLHSGPSSLPHYRAGLGGGCCHLEDTAALRMIVVWMGTVAVVVLVALVVEIVSAEQVVEVGDVVTDHPNCSFVGSNILKLGGNAVDAAVAAALCLTVAVPHAAGLGGGGVMLVHDLRRNQTTVLDFQEVSPASLDIRHYTDNPETARLGPGSAGVPGLVAGLRHAHQTLGSGLLHRDCCGWGDLMRGTLRLLGKGFPVSGDWQAVKQATLRETNTPGQFREFIKADGYSRPRAAATKAMKQTFMTIFEKPVRNFYSGPVGQRLVKDLTGHLTKEDLAAYSVVEREPVGVQVGQHSVLSSPAPSAGPELLAVLGAVEGLVRQGETTFDSAGYLDKLSGLLEGLHREARLLGDPAADEAHQHEPGFVSVAERTAGLLRRDNQARWLSGRGEDRQAAGTDAWQAGSHLAVMDDRDLYVTAVLSLGGQFGSRSFSQGFLLNNALASFDLSPLLGQTRPGEKASSNLFAESRRPLSRMAPVVAVASEPCGLRILAGSALAEVAAQALAPVVLSPNGDMARSLDAPKLVMVNGTVTAEAGLDPLVLQQLELDSLQRTFSPTSALEKVLNKVTGFTDHRGGPRDHRWATLVPKYIKN